MINIIIALEFIFVILFIGKTTLNYSNWLYESKHDGFAGNFIGGIIGGITAYCIAKYQMSKQAGFEKQKRVKRMQMEFIALKQELKYNDSFISLVKNKFNNNNQKIVLSNCPINDNVWDGVKLDDSILDELSVEEYNEVSDLYLELKVLKNPNETSYNINSLDSIKNKFEKCNSIIEKKVGNFNEK